MPSNNPRVMLTIPADLDAILQRVATLQEIPKTRLIVNCLQEFKEPLVELANALELVKAKKDPTQVLMAMTARMLQGLGAEITQYQDKLNLTATNKDIKNAND